MRVLVISQVYPPDPAAAGQQLADAARAMTARGHGVSVITADRGYDDTTVRLARQETVDGVAIRRARWSSFGKQSTWHRLLGGASFAVQATLAGLRGRRPDVVVVSTAPPLAALAALIINRLRGVPYVYWVMDVNPDLAVALGVFDRRALPVRILEWFNRQVLLGARQVVVLDRFMAARLSVLALLDGRLSTVPPWAHDDALSPLAREESEFRRLHGFGERVVVLYSGNHSRANPLDTVLAAARRLEDVDGLVFAFVGGGTAKREVEASGLRNVRCFPYQPQQSVRDVLAAADVHLVTMGDNVLGMVHPSKVYSALAMARPVVYVGPRTSHVGELPQASSFLWQVEQGDVDALEALLRRIARVPGDELAGMGRCGWTILHAHFAPDVLRGRLCDLVERAGHSAREGRGDRSGASANVPG